MADALGKLICEIERRRINRREPQAIGSILGELISRRGLARVRSQEHIENAWRQAIGELGAQYTRLGVFRRGVLEILVANSVLLQELAGFQKQTLLERMQQALQSEQIREIRFRLDGSV
jgi:hypothetical protein